MKLLNWATAVVGKEKTGGYSPLRSSNEPAPYFWMFFSSNLLLNFNNWMDLKVGTKPRATGPCTFPRASALWVPIRGHVHASRLPGVPRAGQGRGAGAVPTGRDSSLPGACDGNTCRPSAGQACTQLQEAVALPGSLPTTVSCLPPQKINTLKNSLAAGMQ